MDTLLKYVTGFGLASGAGSKACIPLLLLGIFHYTPYFDLPDQFLWLASPPVLGLLAVLVAVELYLDAHPDIGEHYDYLSYLPTAASGFIAFAASTGKVDENLAQLGASGILGSATSVSAHYLRNRVRAPVRESAEDVHEKVGKAATGAEAAGSATLSVAAIVYPLIALVIVVALGVVGWLIWRKIDARRVPCVHCREPIRPRATVCPHCKKDQNPAAT